MEISTDCKLDAAGQVQLDPTLTTLVGAASLAAYTDFANRHSPHYTPPQLEYGSRPFTFLERFTGFDDVVWGSGEQERYGLIYQWSARSDVYLIAFRGTASAYDMILDLESGLTADFKPYQVSNNFPSSVHVGDGFYKIYATKNARMAQSMQEQLFTKLAALPTPPAEIIITGHSLGCALASLFALDMAVSLPKVSIANLNFASPRVGVNSWAKAYDNTYGLMNKTIRIRNQYDIVPKVPPSDWPFDFKHVGHEFDVSFTLKSYLHIDFPAVVVAWHSLLNYRYVVDRAVLKTPQVWTGSFKDQAKLTWDMLSNDPHAVLSRDEMNELKAMRPAITVKK